MQQLDEQTNESPMPHQQESNESAIHVTGLSHWYRVGKKKDAQNIEALKSVSFDVRRGEIFGILGPNGGGKTTLFKIISTMLKPNGFGAADHACEVQIEQHCVLDQPNQVRQLLGVVFQSPSLDDKLTARENLIHHGHLYGLTGKPLEQRIDQLLEQFNLSNRKNDLTERFSGGMKRKVEVAKAILHHPKVLILDEPSTGLDPAARRDLWLIIHDLVQKNNMTVAMTTHLMDEAEKCDRLAILSKGELVGSGTPSELKDIIGGDVITVVPEDHQNESAAPDLAAGISTQFNGWEHGGEPKVVDGVVRCEHNDGAEMVAKISGAFAGKIKSITVGQPTLEDVFVHLTGAKFEDN